MRVAVLLAILLAADTAHAAVGPLAIDFDRDVAPLLSRRCLDCHRGATPEGGLDLSRRSEAMEAIAPGKANASALWRRVRDHKMPPGKPLPADEKAILRAWIARGA